MKILSAPISVKNMHVSHHTATDQIYCCRSNLLLQIHCNATDPLYYLDEMYCLDVRLKKCYTDGGSTQNKNQEEKPDMKRRSLT